MCNALKAEPVVVTWCQSSPEIAASCLNFILLCLGYHARLHTGYRSRSKWNGENFSGEKEKEEKKKRNSLAETASKDSSLRPPYCLIQTLGFLLWVTNNGFEEEMLIIKKFPKESAIIVRGISSFRAKCKFLPIFQIKNKKKRNWRIFSYSFNFDVLDFNRGSEKRLWWANR